MFTCLVSNDFIFQRSSPHSKVTLNWQALEHWIRWNLIKKQFDRRVYVVLCLRILFYQPNIPYIILPLFPCSDVLQYLVTQVQVFKARPATSTKSNHPHFPRITIVRIKILLGHLISITVTLWRIIPVNYNINLFNSWDNCHLSLFSSISTTSSYTPHSATFYLESVSSLVFDELSYKTNWKTFVISTNVP